MSPNGFTPSIKIESKWPVPRLLRMSITCHVCAVKRYLPPAAPGRLLQLDIDPYCHCPLAKEYTILPCVPSRIIVSLPLGPPLYVPTEIQIAKLSLIIESLGTEL